MSPTMHAYDPNPLMKPAARSIRPAIRVLVGDCRTRRKIAGRSKPAAMPPRRQLLLARAQALDRSEHPAEPVDPADDRDEADQADDGDLLDPLRIAERPDERVAYALHRCLRPAGFRTARGGRRSATRATTGHRSPS